MDAVKTVLEGKFTAVNNHTEKEERSQINNLTSHLKTRKSEHIILKQSRKEITIRVEIN